MDRRRFLTLALTSAGTVSVAGCGGLSGDDEPPENGAEGDGDDGSEADGGVADGGEDETEVDDDTDEIQAQQHVDEALNHLLENAGVLERYTDQETDREAAELEEIRSRAGQARDALSEAMALAPDAMYARIDALEATAAFQTALAENHDLARELNEQIEAAIDAQNRDEFREAAELFEDAGETIAAYDTQLETLGQRQEDIDHDEITEPELDYSGPLLSYLQLDDRRDIGVQAQMMDALARFSLTVDATDNGRALYLEANYERSLENFQFAAERGTEAAEILGGVLEADYVPDDVEPLAETYFGLAERYLTALDFYLSAADQARQGNEDEADDLFADGDEVLGIEG